jgi:hypothetical protein
MKGFTARPHSLGNVESRLALDLSARKVKESGERFYSVGHDGQASPQSWFVRMNAPPLPRESINIRGR